MQKTSLIQLLCAFIVILLLPDYDGFIAERSSGPPLLSLVTGIPQDLVIQHSFKIVLALSMLAGAGFVVLALRNSFYRWLAFSGLLMCGYGILRLMVAGLGLRGSFTGVNASFISFALIGAMAASRAHDFFFRAGIVAGVMSVAFVKLIYAVWVFRTGGAVEMITGVPSLAADGGTLSTWATAALWCGSYGAIYLSRKEYARTAWCTLGLTIFLIALAATFRRTNLIRVLGMMAVMVLLAGYMRRRSLRAFVGVASVVFILGGILIGSTVVIFGLADSYERALSLSPDSGSKYGGTNEAYSDDWQAWIGTVLEHYGLGVGPGQPYGVQRLVEEVENAAMTGEIPLHTGSYEMLASFGPAGLIFQFGALVGLPLVAVHFRRKSHVPLDPLFTASAAFLLWIGLWPFGPPLQFNQATLVFTAIQAGIVCATQMPTGRADRLSSRPRLLQRRPATPSVPLPSTHAKGRSL